MGRKRPAKAATASDDELIQDAIGRAQAEREGRIGSRREIREIPEDRAFEPEADDDLALFAAVRNGMDVNEAGALLINGANANYAAADGDTALCWACSLSPAHPASVRALRMVELLVRHGAAVNQQSKSGAALARASYAGNVDAVQLLIQLGADVNQQGDDGGQHSTGPWRDSEIISWRARLLVADRRHTTFSFRPPSRCWTVAPTRRLWITVAALLPTLQRRHSRHACDRRLASRRWQRWRSC